MTPTRTEIIILATRTQNVLGEKGRRIRELTAVVQKRFSFEEGTVEVSSSSSSSHDVSIKRHSVLLSSSCMQRKLPPEVYVPLLNVNRSVTSLLEDWPSEGTIVHVV